MRNNSFIILMGSMMVLFIGIIFTSKISPKKEITHDRISYLRDSLEMEYYKKQLESYQYDNSKISTDDTIKRNGEPPKSLRW